MTEQLCGLPVSLLARDKGFDEICRATFERRAPDEWVPNETTQTKLADLTEDARIMLVKRPGIWDGGEIRNSKLSQWLLARPTQDLLCRWLRETHSMILDVSWYSSTDCYHVSFGIHDNFITNMPREFPFTDYEVAREAGLEALLKLIQ